MINPTGAAGAIVTFSRYKRGVGRSMAVANVGRLVARNRASSGQKTLLIDWDLDAPGPHRVLQHFKTLGPWSDRIFPRLAWTAQGAPDVNPGGSYEVFRNPTARTPN